MSFESEGGLKFRLGELFCGPGGIATGAMAARVMDVSGESFSVTHAWATDYDAATCRTYTRNICPEHPESVLCDDIRQLDLDVFHGISEIDALAFGFPCNDFSQVGEQKGVHGSFGPLYKYGVEVLKRYQPKWFMAENVGGLRSANDGTAFSRILLEMFNAGYSLYPHYYSFDRYGVPQSRQRIIIVGIRKDLPFKFRVPSPEPFAHCDNTCRSAIENPPIPANAPNNELTRQSAEVVDRLRYIKPGQNAFTAELPERLRLNVRGARISQIYKRLDPNRPAYTVTGSGGGGTHMYHWSEPRALTNRERARLQTFPDTFVFEGSKEEVRKQIGMAVPCKGAQVIVEAILKTFADVPYASVKSSFPPMIHLRETPSAVRGEEEEGSVKDLYAQMEQPEMVFQFYEHGSAFKTGWEDCVVS